MDKISTSFLVNIELFSYINLRDYPIHCSALFASIAGSSALFASIGGSTHAHTHVWVWVDPFASSHVNTALKISAKI